MVYKKLKRFECRTIMVVPMGQKMEFVFVFFSRHKETDFEVLIPTNKRQRFNIYMA